MYIIIILCLVALILFIFELPVFGGKPSQHQLMRIKAQPNYEKGEFQNQSPTPTLPPDVTYWSIIKLMIKGNNLSRPDHPLPSVAADFTPSIEPKLTWFGHSSYLVQVDSLNIAIDPVFSERPSPFQFLGTKRFDGTDFMDAEKLPPLDVVLITHDHYDHLDYQAIRKLKDRTKLFITSLGVGAHLLSWGIKSEQLVELAWYEKIVLPNGLSFTALPARHFSGRTFKRNQTLWSSFMLETSAHKLYLGGDSGYDGHFKWIGEQYGPFDLAVLECGQYNKMWPLIHLFPEQVLQVAIDLKAKKLLPVHWAKYKLALHDWDEPINRLIAAADSNPVPIMTPMLGESFYLGDLPTKRWWKN